MTGEVVDEVSQIYHAIIGKHRQIEDDIARRDELINRWALLVSPWQVGDVCKGQGYTFTKKDCRVTAVTGRLNYNKTPKVQIVAKVLKADGSDSAHSSDWTWVPK